VLIRFSRSKGVPVLTCVRDDGSSTYSKSRHGEFFALHDLLHYAVESTLGLRDSFFGLVARGWTIADFNEPGISDKLPPEAGQTEYIVGLLLQDSLTGEPGSAKEFNRTLMASYAQRNRRGLPPPHPLSDDELRRIHERYTELLARYRSLEPGQHLEVSFP